MNQSSLIIMLCLAFTWQTLGEVPKVGNVRASQREGTKLVDIYYDVEDAENDKLTIRVEISSDGGERYIVPSRTFEGDIGANIDPGTNKHITWYAGLDWDGEFSDKMRVRVTATDGKGLPGLEWSREIPPGGFLMGQDGGEEGSGPSKHINLKYSFWMSKYPITVQQYVEFLNLAHAAGICTSGGVMLGDKVRALGRNFIAINLGDARQIRWNVSRFEIVGSRGNQSVLVSYSGAAAFAEFYGLDLPYEFEWEKAARGPKYDDEGEHKVYPTKIIDPPTGEYVNEYGINDINATGVWTRSRFEGYNEYKYKSVYGIKNLDVWTLDNESLMVKGNRKTYERQATGHSASLAFRVARRAGE